VTRVRIATVGVALAVVAVAVAFGVHPWSLHRPDRSPARPADFVTVLDNPPSSRHSTGKVLTPDRAILAGPHFGLRYLWIETTAHDPTGAYRAAARHEFLFVLGEHGTGGSYLVRPEDQVTAAVVVDGVSRPLPRVPTTGLLVSVPTGHGATLTVTDEGRTQSLDLRSGLRRSDEIPGYYRSQRIDMTGLEYNATGIAVAAGHLLNVKISVQFYQASVSVEPWVPGLGWAQSGHAWLQMSTVVIDAWVTPHGNDILNAYAFGADLVTDFPTSFTVAVSGGPEVAAKPGTTWGLQAQVTLFFDVPEYFTSGALVIHPGRTLRPHKLDPIPAVWRQTPATGQLPLAIE
jgi:hypothetical protein